MMVLSFRPTVALLAAAVLTTCTRPPGTSAGRGELVYIGTNVGDPAANSIYLYRLTPTTGELKLLAEMKGGASPTYLTLDARRNYLYAVSETQTYQGRPGGAVSSFAIDWRNARLTMLNQQPSWGASPCYISLDGTGKSVLVANYMGGDMAWLPVRSDGQLGASTAIIYQRHPSTGPHKNQDTPHPHCFITAPDNRFAFVVDLGTDKVNAYRLFDTLTMHQRLRSLSELRVPAFIAKPGAGPRHLTFHPNGRWAYLENELNSTVTALTYNAAAGTFQEIETEPSRTLGFVGETSGADVHVSPDGRFLYTSSRGDNSLSVFAIDVDSGHLTLVQNISTQGKTPRNFALDPTGQVLLVANQNSGNIFTYRIDKQTGTLTATGQSVELPSPMFVAVVPDFTR